MKETIFGIGMMITGAIAYAGVSIRDIIVTVAPNSYLSGTDCLHYIGPGLVVVGFILACYGLWKKD